MAKPFPLYALRHDETTRSGLIRVLKSMQEAAGELAHQPESQSTDTIHDLRTLIKRLRAYVWFLRTLSGKARYRQYTAALRRAAHRLSEARDLHAIKSALDEKANPQAEEGDLRVLAYASQAIVQNEERVVGTISQKITADAVIRTIDKVIKCIDRTTRHCPSPKSRLKKAFRQTRQAGKRALQEGNQLLVHEWRKKTKRLFYLLQLTAQLPKLGTPAALESIDKLQELLGNFQDSVVAENHLRHHPPGDDTALARQVIAALKKNRKLLLKKARHRWHSLSRSC